MSKQNKKFLPAGLHAPIRFWLLAKISSPQGAPLMGAPCSDAH
jgi:hypothetical protein